MLDSNMNAKEAKTSETLLLQKLDCHTHSSLMDAHGLQFALCSQLELFVRDTVWAKSGFVGARSRLERIRSAAVSSINQTHELRRAITVVVLQMSGVSNGKKAMQMDHTGGLKVPVATSQRGLKIRKSARGVPRVFDFAVRTQKMDGSM